MNVLNNSIPKKMIFLSLLLASLLYNCNNSNSWNQDERDELIADCIKAGKDKVSNTLEIKNICECSIEKFTSEFNLEEYNQIQTQEVLSVDLNGRLNLIIELIAQDCNIFYNSSISFK